MKFLGRKKELEELNHYYQHFVQGNKVLIGCKGRRRVGKTRFITHFIEKKITTDSHLHLYFLSFIGKYSATSAENIKNCYAEIVRFVKQFENEELTKLLVKPKNWTEFFFLLTDIVKYFDQNQIKLLIFYDELSWYSKRNEFWLAFTSFWNKDLTNYDNVMIFVAGSNNSWLEHKIFQNKSEFFSRISVTIHLKPFSFQEIYDYCKTYDMDDLDIVIYYFIFGGIIFYYQNIDMRSTLQKNLELIVQRKEMFFKEYNILYEGLFQDRSKKKAIFQECLARICKSKQVNFEQLSDIASEDLVREVLQNLVDNDLIIAEQSGFKSQQIYMINDLFIYFINYWKDRFDLLKNLDQFFSTWKGNAFEIMSLNKWFIADLKIKDPKIYLNFKFKTDKEHQVDILLEETVLNAKKQEESIYYLIENKSYFDQKYFDIEDLMDLFAKGKRFNKLKGKCHMVLLTLFPIKLSRKFDDLQKENQNIIFHKISLLENEI